MIYKTCTKCFKVKKANEFHFKIDGKFGLASWCKQCRSEYRKKGEVDNVKYNKTNDK